MGKEQEMIWLLLEKNQILGSASKFCNQQLRFQVTSVQQPMKSGCG
jgi:hypothetical protein